MLGFTLPPLKFRHLWLCLLGLTFLFGMPATYATADCSTNNLQQPTIALSQVSDGIKIDFTFPGNRHPNSYEWSAEIKRGHDDWEDLIEDELQETSSYYLNDTQYLYWSGSSKSMGVEPGDFGHIKAKARSHDRNCSHWSTWGHSSVLRYDRPED
ncbi:MAG: hypothetical protein OXN81_11305 [Alphaproteobacteria bacterium]|nr:hypothetical protein [Alphaproteobacteria bacterium]